MKKIKKENMIIIIAAIIMVILIVLIVVFTMMTKNKDNKEKDTISTEVVQLTNEEQYWLLTDMKTGVTTSTPGWSTEDTYNGTPWSEATTEDTPYVWYYTTKDDEVVMEPCIWYEYEETSTTEDVTEEDSTTEMSTTETVSGDNDEKEDEDDTESTQSSNNGGNSSGNGGNNSSQQSGHDGNTGSNNGGQSTPSVNQTPSTPTTEAPSSTEAPSTTETPSTTEAAVHEHEWVEVWGEKEVQIGSVDTCLYCGYEDIAGDTIVEHCGMCGGVWTYEELKDKSTYVQNALIGQPKGSNWTLLPVYGTVDAILYYECDCGSIKPAN